MRTDSQRAQRAGTGQERARRGQGDRGAILAESALITPLFIFIIFGLIEFGAAYRDYLTVSNAASQGTRVAAIQGNDPTADWTIVQAIKKASGAFPVSQIQRIVVFHAASSTSTVPTGCKTGSSGTTDNAPTTYGCNIFTSTEIALATTPSTWKCPLVAPAAASQSVNPIAYWCSTSRKVNLTAATGGPPDYVGIYIEIKHPWITGLFGSNITLTDTSITQLEPQKI